LTKKFERQESSGIMAVIKCKREVLVGNLGKRSGWIFLSCYFRFPKQI